MYAAINGLEQALEQMVTRIMQECGWSVLRHKNVVGNTAEDLAIRNSQFKCARILQVIEQEVDLSNENCSSTAYTWSPA